MSGANMATSVKKIRSANPSTADGFLKILLRILLVSTLIFFPPQPSLTRGSTVAYSMSITRFPMTNNRK